MKAFIIQPYYSLNGKEDIEKCYNAQLALMDECDESADIIILPEYCDCQSYMGSTEAFLRLGKSTTQILIKKSGKRQSVARR